MDEKIITDPALIAVALAYCGAQRIDCWAMRTPPTSTIGGFACRLLSIDGDTALTRIANDDLVRVPLAELHLRAGDPWA